MTVNNTSAGKGLATFSCLLFAVTFCLCARADGYVTLTKGTSYNAGFSGAAWSEAVADPSTRDYLVNNPKYVFYTTSGETVNAKSLTFGEVGGGAAKYYTYYSATFENNGIIFANGEAYLNATSPTLAGKATFTSPSTAPFRFYGTHKNDGRGFVFSGDVHSAETAGILVYANTHTDFYFTFSGDASDYLGSIVVTSNYDMAGAPLGAEFRLSGSASNFGGSITVRDGAKFHPTITTSVKSLALESGATLLMNADNTLTVGSLTIEEGATLSMNAGNTLTVNTALTVNGGPVPIALSGAPSAAVSDVTCHALITMPADSACTEADFSLPNYGSSVYTKPKLVMRTSGDTKTLYAEYYPIVTLTNGDTAADPAVTNGAYWSDGKAVHDSAHYQVGRVNNRTTQLTTPYAPDETLVFPGESLRFGSYTVFQLRVGDYAVSNLMFNCGTGSQASEIFGLDGEDITLRGNFSVSGQVDFGPRKSGIIRMVGPMTGTSGSLINLCGSAAGTSQCRGIVVFDGDNTGYAGKFRVTLDYPGNLTFGSEFMSLRTSSAASLGGPMPEFAYDALRLDTAGRLEAYGTFTMDEPTRGVFISGQGRFYVKTNETLSVKEQLTVNGRAYKEGPGMLALGGALRFLDSEGELTETPPAEVTNRTFYVTGGRIKPLSAHSLDGLDVVFSNKTSKLDVGITMDIEPEDAELRAKGICNAKSENPFSVQSDNADEKINIALACANPEQGKIYEFAIMTLTNTVADAVFDRLAFTRPEGFTQYGLALERTSDTETGTKTLRATYKLRGFQMCIR